MEVNTVFLNELQRSNNLYKGRDIYTYVYKN